VACPGKCILAFPDLFLHGAHEHRLHVSTMPGSSPLFWCSRCGYHAQNRLGCLRLTCRGNIPTQACVLRYLRQGRHPAQRKKRIGKPLRISAALVAAINEWHCVPDAVADVAPPPRPKVDLTGARYLPLNHRDAPCRRRVRLRCKTCHELTPYGPPPPSGSFVVWTVAEPTPPTPSICAVQPVAGAGNATVSAAEPASSDDDEALASAVLPPAAGVSRVAAFDERHSSDDDEALAAARLPQAVPLAPLPRRRAGLPLRVRQRLDAADAANAEYAQLGASRWASDWRNR